MNTNKIILRQLALSCIIGIDEAEQPVRQAIRIDAEISLKTLPTDDKTPLVNYADLVETLRLLARENRFGLLETFAEQAAQTLLTPEAVSEVRLYCHKPKIFPDIREIGIEITRSKTP